MDLIRKTYQDSMGPWHEGTGADDIIAGINILRTGHFHGMLANLPYPSGEKFKEGLPMTYSDLAGQMRRYGATATGTIFNPIQKWGSIKEIVRCEYRDIIFRKEIALGEKFDLFSTFSKFIAVKNLIWYTITPSNPSCMGRWQPES